MSDNLDKKRYIDLLKKFEILPKKGESFIRKNMEEWIELDSCQKRFESQIYYNAKENYFSLIENYIMGIINATEFRSDFYLLIEVDQNFRVSLEKDFKKLSTFPIDPKSEGLFILIEEIYEECYKFDSDDLEDMIDRTSEDGSVKSSFLSEFQDFMEEVFLQMEKYK